MGFFVYALVEYHAAYDSEDKAGEYPHIDIPVVPCKQYLDNALNYGYGLEI